MKPLSLRLILGIFALGFLAASGIAQTSSGAIKAMKVSGTVTRIDHTGATTAVTEGLLLTESDTILTGADSGVVLVFMNGSAVKLGANSRLLIEQFKMDPLAGDIDVSTLTKEPSVSQTSLNLAYGDLVGDVKKLNKSSTYNIKTPVGAAGIRGTTFRIVLTPSADGKTFTFSLATAEGLVAFSATIDGAAIEVGAGTQVGFTAEIDPATGLVTSSQVTTEGISAEAAAAIQQAVTEVIQQALNNGAVFTPAEQQSGGTGSGGSGASAGGEAAGTESGGTGTSTSNTSGTSTFTPPTTGGTGGTTVDEEGKPVIDGSPSN